MALTNDVVEPGDVARRPHVRHVRLEELVRFYADVRLETGALEDVDVHREAEANTDHVGRRGEAFGTDDLELPVPSLEPVDRLVVVQMHAGVLREKGDDLATVFIEGAPEKPRPAHEPVRLEAAMREGFGQLVSDERPAEHNRDLRLRDPRDHSLRFVEVLKVEGNR